MNGSGSYTSAPFIATISGTYRWVSTYSGDAEVTGGTSGCNAPAESVVVTPPTPLVLTTQVSESGPGAPLVDNATLSGGVNPRTGTITFELYGPGDPLCAGPPIFTSPGLLLLPDFYASNGYFPVDAGTYRWVAFYSGDANNAPVGPTACGDPAETVEVLPPGSLTTQASGSVEVGGTLTDTATLETDPSATGVIVFGLFGPDDLTCSGEPIAVSFAPVAGPGSYTSEPFTATAPGTYHWVAQYSGDGKHPEIGPTGCADPAETVVVTAPPPSERGFLTICKSRSNGATGNYVFTVDGRSFTVAAGQCSPSIRLLAGEATVTEVPTIGFKLARCATAPADRLVACNRNAGSAVVSIHPGGVAKQTVLTFTNKAATGELKVCKVAGNGVAPGSRHVFQVNGRPVVVKAGSGPGGGCVAAGSFPVGTHVDVDERVKPAERVSAIAVRPASRLVGTPDLDAGRVTVVVDSGVTEVRFTDVVR